jgi:hypothetical protein
VTTNVNSAVDLTANISLKSRIALHVNNWLRILYLSLVDNITSFTLPSPNNPSFTPYLGVYVNKHSVFLPKDPTEMFRYQVYQ